MIWNESGFADELSISRNEVMKLSKVGNANTYTKVLKELDEFGYIKYSPSYNPLIGSKVTIIRCDKGSDKGVGNGSGNSSDKGGDTLFKPIKLIKPKETITSNSIELDVNAKSEIPTNLFDVDEKPKPKKTPKPKKEKEPIPTLQEVFDYVKSIPEFSRPEKFESYKFAISAKIETWIEDGWKDGNGKEVINWKNKIKNTLPYLKPLNNGNNGNNPYSKPTIEDRSIATVERLNRERQELINSAGYIP
jgi:hypothetical protein